MNRKIGWSVVLACATLLAACDDLGDTSMFGDQVVLKDKQVVLSPKGQPKAYIDANGNLSINDKPVSVTPEQQALLMAYYMDVADVHHTGTEMGKAGGKVAIQALAHAASSAEGKAAEQTAQQLSDMGMKICKDTAAIKTVQDQLGAQLPAFKPYAGIVSDASVSDCMDEHKEDSDGKPGKDA
ncbi:DUF2884 family protein [Dyella sp.]|uniref:DUF2884 family protein n=1 Tax=Dyella sp. TaxID=1869338 RepID=UPI002ED328CA